MHVALASAHGLAVMDQDEEDVALALAGIGIEASVVAWDDPDVDWAGFDAVVIRSTWDYLDRVDAYLDWVRRVDAVTLLLNPAAVVEWNLHKGYLLELEERGAPIVPTAFLGRGDRVDLAELATDRGWDGIVAKPAVGAGAIGLLVVRPGEDLAAAQPTFAALCAEHDVLVQPFVPSIADGELSVVVVDGRVSHAVRKRPSDDEVRIQIEFGGVYEAEEVDLETARLAEWLVEVTGHDLLYARVDLLADVDGQWLLGELELVEPALMFRWAPGSVERFAEAVRRRVAGVAA